jgi:hypothetical protein
MSYIRAHQVNRERTNPFSDFTHVETPDLDANLDGELLDFVLKLIAKIDALPEGEALVVWKEIF